MAKQLTLKERYLSSPQEQEASQQKQQLSDALDTGFYFAHPYSSWERGLNEHMPERSDKCPWGTNGLIRQYLPKKTDFTQISKEEIIIIQDKLNHRPRKVLGYRTPYEVFFTEFAKVLAA